MAKMRIYSLFDRKLREYGALVILKNDEAVIRAVRDGVRGTGSTQEKYPEDFDLMTLGVFDDETGELIGGPPTLVRNLEVVVRGDVPPSSVFVGGE